MAQYKEKRDMRTRRNNKTRGKGAFFMERNIEERLKSEHEKSANRKY